VLELVQAASFDDAVTWATNNPDVVREGYAFSKEAVIVWTMLTSSHLIKRGIRINCTAPGPTQTPMMKYFEAATPMATLDMAMQPINRRSTPEEQAGPLVFLNSPAASYINGVLLPVDGGFMGGMATGQIQMPILSGAAA
jgi:NAD(P)-dependent dehydrogenase (short-subunit alcohol dehydrogenase family)